MRKLKFSLLTLIVSLFTSLNAQELLKVTYAHQMSMDIDSMLKGSNDAEMRKALKKGLEEVHYYELISSPTESIFKKIQKINNDLPKEDDTGSISVSSGSGYLYKDLIEKESISKIENFDETFLVRYSLDNYNWEITREKSNILGYEVRKATYSDDKQKITAWYAPNINIKDGPNTYIGLPGLILKVEVQYTKNSNKKFYFVAENIEVVDDKNLIEKPKGKLYSKEEYQKIFNEQLRKMKEMYSQGVDKDD